MDRSPTYPKRRAFGSGGQHGSCRHTAMDDPPALVTVFGGQPGLPSTRFQRVHRKDTYSAREVAAIY